MKKLASLFFAVFSLVLLTGASWLPLFKASGAFVPSCAQSSTFLTAATGVTLTADKTNYDTMICGLVSDGVWNFDVLYIWAAPSASNAALINLANPGTFNGTTHGTVSFAAYQGYTGDTSTFYIDPSFNPTTATTPNFVQNSATVGVYVLSNRSTGQNWWSVGSSDDGGVAFLPLAQTGPNVDGIRLNSASLAANGAANAQGTFNYTRTASNLQSVFLNSNETAVASASDTSIAPHNASIFFFSDTAGFGNTGDQLAAGWIGAGLSAVSSCKVNNRINTYMATLASPQNVYSNSAC